MTYNPGWGIFGICFGAMVLMYGVCGGAAGGGAYGAGMCCGGLFGLLIFVSGIYYTIRG